MRKLIPCALLLVAFAALSWLAAQTKCATFDEPLHAASAYMSTFYGDYRIDPEDPALWKYWAMIPHRRADLAVEQRGKYWDWMINDPRNQSVWCDSIIFHTSGIDGVAFIDRSRFMFLIVGLAVGATIAFWSWRLAGAVGAIVATALYALDPAFLGHAPLIKNDVLMTLCMLTCMIAIYRAGVRLTIANVLAAGAVLGASWNIKFSGLLLVPMIFLALLTRALVSDPWPSFAGQLATRVRKLAAAAGCFAGMLFLAVAITWASYRFRFAAGPDGSLIDPAPTRQLIAENRFYLANHRMPAGDEAKGWESSLTVRAAGAMERWHLLPQAWIEGFLSTYAGALVRPAFLVGRFYDAGCWYYFPLVMLFKMPVATLAAIALAGGVAIAAPRRGLPRGASLWRAVCLVMPPALYLAIAMSSNLNLGIRHLLPIMPFVYILIGLAAASARERWPRSIRIAAALGLLLAIETLAAFPDFLAFFNFPSGGTRGGLRLLSDSNLDWGQDLPALLVWQEAHPGVPYYLLYFGRAGEEAYGLHSLDAIDRPCIFAVSASTLQGLYVPEDKKEIFRELRDKPPVAVLNGTIYLYRFPEDLTPRMSAGVQAYVSQMQGQYSH